MTPLRRSPISFDGRTPVKVDGPDGADQLLAAFMEQEVPGGIDGSVPDARLQLLEEVLDEDQFG